MDPDRRDALEARKRASFAQLLLKAARLLNERAVDRARAALAAPGLRPAHLALAPHIPFEGIRQSELARRLGVTRQAVGELVGDLVALGVLELVPDPDDRRAKRVRFSAAGEDGLFTGLSILEDLERELARDLGDARAADLRASLAAIVARLEG
ncbi:MAG: MarR family transcriptional regulator [Myxococcales bacterium]|nr:MarR family transcriptional regulator [Myxococcales bacterium]MCB9735299.1 MarR family transcriptional regulator [Deltaproteobacteria bacterium]